MPRRRDDDSGELMPRRSSGGSLLWLWLLLGIGGGVLVVCGGFAAALAMWSRPPAAKPDGVDARTYSRDEFRTLVMGKTEKEVIAAVGKADSTLDHGKELGQTWWYDRRTVDPVTGKIDVTAHVEFGKDGVVYEVTFG